MSKYRFIQYIIINLYFVVCPSITGQTTDQIATMYHENRFVELHDLLQRNLIRDADWRSFLEALFMENADSAIKKLVSLYMETRDIELKQVIRKRTSSYYYARGYYETAQKILDDELFFQQIASIQKSYSYYGIQVGAFSTYKNALNARSKLLKNYPEVTIIKKIVKGRKLYVIVVGRHNSRKEAEAALKKLKSKYKINGYVVQY